MRLQPDKKYFIASCVFHTGILLALILSYEFSRPLAVIENTNEHDVISAVILGDTAKSKVLPHEKPATKPIPKPEPVKKAEPEPQKDVIALKAAEKKLVVKKEQDLKKKQQAAFAKDLLADIKKQSDKKIKKPDIQAKFAKTLREQSEASLRQNLLNEDIKMTGKLSRQSQGVVDKYTALIVQSISEHWLVPSQANKSLTSVLMISLNSDGMVVDVQVIKSSGDPSLDSSARAAVFKSSPLPVPSKPEEFAPFKRFEMKVTPKDIIQG